MPDALRLIIDRLCTEQKVRPPVRLCDRISAAADSRAWLRIVPLHRGPVSWRWTVASASLARWTSVLQTHAVLIG
jgi:hypothetical protein